MELIPINFVRARPRNDVLAKQRDILLLIRSLSWGSDSGCFTDNVCKCPKGPAYGVFETLDQTGSEVK